MLRATFSAPGSRLIAFLLVNTALLVNTILLATGTAEELNQLPLKRIALFHSGVGFHEHHGQIEGTQEVELPFEIDDINDVLKSLVLQDLDGGQITSVSYDTREPVERVLKRFKVDLTSEPTIGDLLRQVRGERITLDANTPISGVLLGIELRQEIVGRDQVASLEFVNLLMDN
jgi:hypothetical protein